MQMEKDLNTKAMKELFEAFLQIKTPQECRGFLRDLCTFAELKAMAERLQIAKAVAKKMSYREISNKTGASTATVTRVSHWFHHGMGGYKLVLERCK